MDELGERQEQLPRQGGDYRRHSEPDFRQQALGYGDGARKAYGFPEALLRHHEDSPVDQPGGSGNRRRRGPQHRRRFVLPGFGYERPGDGAGGKDNQLHQGVPRRVGRRPRQHRHGQHLRHYRSPERRFRAAGAPEAELLPVLGGLRPHYARYDKGVLRR